MGIVAEHTKPNFHPMAQARVIAAIKVVLTTRIVPSVTPLIPAKCVVSVDRKEVSAPAEFSCQKLNISTQVRHALHDGEIVLENLLRD